jgi:hypothetical protein
MLEARVTLAVNTALAELLRCDSYLLESDVNERSITHRLATYLQSQFPDWHVDCEYNRNHDDVKRLELAERQTTDVSLVAVTVYPDIIVHRRDTDENLLVIEMKKSTNRESSEYDIQKLTAFKRELGYTFAVFVLLGSGVKNAGIMELRFI